MEGFVAQKLHEFENGKLSRRRLIQALTSVATAGASERANAQRSAPALQMALVNHVSYTCPAFQQAADWYSKVFNLAQVGTTKNSTVLPFGREGEQPYGVAARDVPLTHLIVRTPDQNRASEPGAPPRPKSQAAIDHICYTIADFDVDRVERRAEIAEHRDRRPSGTENPPHVLDPFGFDVQISGLASSALTDKAGRPWAMQLRRNLLDERCIHEVTASGDVSGVFAVGERADPERRYRYARARRS